MRRELKKPHPTRKMKELLDFIRQRLKSVTEEEIKREFSNLPSEQILNELTTLEAQNQIKRDKNRHILYVRKAEDDEKFVIEQLEKAKNQGCTMRDFKMGTKLPQSLITKILRRLQDIQKVKVVKGQKNRQKVFMIFNETPDDDVTGGVWFNNGDVDVEFVNQLIKLIYIFVKNRTQELIEYEKNPTLENIKTFIVEAGVLSIRINNTELKKIIDVMVYGQLLQELKCSNRVMYRVLQFNENEL